MSRAPSIRAQLRRFVTLVLLGAGACAALLVWVVARGVVSEERARLQAVAEVTVNATQAEALATRELLAELALRPEVRNPDPAVCGPFLVRTLELLPRYLGATVTDTLGRIRCVSAADPPSDPVPAGDRAWFRDVRGRDTFVVGPPVEGHISGTSIIVFAHPVRDDDGQTVAYLTLSSPTLERFRELVAGLGDELTVVTIATEEGVVVARSRDATDWIGRRLPTAAGPVEDGPQVRGTTLAADGDGVARTWVYRNIPAYGWRVFAGVPRAEVRARVARRTVPVLALFMALLGGLAWIMFRVRASVDRGLTGLVEAMRHSGADPTRRLHLDQGPPEVAAVAEQFDRTVQALNDALEREEDARTRLQSILNNAFFSIFVCDDRGRIQGCNPAMVELLGYASEDEVRALTVAELFMVPHEARELLEGTEGSRAVLETQWRTAEGHEVPVRLHWTVSTDPRGERLIQGITEDLTDRRELEVQFRQAQKLEAVGRLAGGIAHDFNNRLTVIGGQAELLLTELDADDPNREYVDGIVTSTRRAAELTAQLLAFSRRQPLTPRLLDLNDVAGKLVPMLERMVGRGVRLATAWRTVPPVLADAGQVEQVLLNLVTNARDAVEEAGNISISTETGELDDHAARLRGPEVRPGVYAVLAVDDDGEGMQPQVMEHIFEPFFTTKPTGKGTGLGLATVYGITTQYGGHLRVDSRPGSGTRFEVWLPARTEGADSPNGMVRAEADLPLPSGFTPLGPDDPA